MARYSLFVLKVPLNPKQTNKQNKLPGRRLCFKQRKISALNEATLDAVFQSLILYKITYAVQSCSGYLLAQQIDRLQAMLNKAKKWGLVSVLYNLRGILENQDYRLFNQIVTDPQHCLNSTLLQ